MDETQQLWPRERPGELGYDPWFGPGRPPIPWEVLWVALAIMILALIGIRLHRRHRRRKAEEAWMNEVREACEEEGLTEAEEEALLRAIRQVDITVPEAAVDSAGYFDAFIAPVLTRTGGPMTADAIRRKLFGAPRSETAAPGLG